MRSLALVGLWCATTMAVSGCGESGPPTYPVTGKVTMNGAPLKGVNVQFYPVDGAQDKFASGIVDENGNYALTSGAAGKEGAQAGKYDVYLTPVVSESTTEGQYGESKGAGGQRPGAPTVELTFPQNWSQPATTPMKNIEVKEQSNTIDIDVK